MGCIIMPKVKNRMRVSLMACIGLGVAAVHFVTMFFVWAAAAGPGAVDRSIPLHWTKVLSFPIFTVAGAWAEQSFYLALALNSLTWGMGAVLVLTVLIWSLQRAPHLSRTKFPL